jgi:hypothetical protein
MYHEVMITTGFNYPLPKSGVIALIFVSLLGFGISLYGAKEILQQFYLSRTGTRTEGLCIDVKTTHSSRRAHFNSLIEYSRADGHRSRFWIGGDLRIYNKGDSVPVIYDPNSELEYVDDVWNFGAGTLVMLAIGLVMLLVGLVPIVQNFRFRRL